MKFVAGSRQWLVWVKRIIIIIVFLIFHAVYYMLPSASRAQDILKSPQYRLELSPFTLVPQDENVNSKLTPKPEILPVTGPSGILVKTGFTSILAIEPFVFSISPTTIDFNTLLPGNAVIRSSSIAVQTGSSTGFTVITQADSSLSTSRGEKIVDTTCLDKAKSQCSTTHAALWTKPDVVGFGYNLTGDSVSSDFVSQDYFRPFPKKTAGEEAVTFMDGSTITSPQKATIRYKILIDNDQPGGVYTNSIQFIAVPRY